MRLAKLNGYAAEDVDSVVDAERRSQMSCGQEEALCI